METMQAFIDAYEGKPVLQYEGNWVQTDTDFKKIPYWVDKEQLKGNIKQSYVDKGKHKKSIKLNKKKETESSLLKPEANIYYDELVKRVVEGGKKK